MHYTHPGSLQAIESDSQFLSHIPFLQLPNNGQTGGVTQSFSHATPGYVDPGVCKQHTYIGLQQCLSCLEQFVSESPISVAGEAWL